MSYSRIILLLALLTLSAEANEAAYVRSYTEHLAPWPGETKGKTPQFDGIDGRILTGYQGWFRCEGDGSDMGWYHYNLPIKGEGHQFRPGYCSIDLWPDLTEYSEEERFPTPFRRADGSTAELFSSQHPKTVDRHFQWMADYGIDGAFVQRFANVANPQRKTYEHLVADNRKLMLCRDAANKAGTCWALMFDLSGVKPENMDHVIRDWTLLRKHMDIGNDPNYLHYNGKPLVAVWGGGFEGEDRPRIDQVIKFVRLLKQNPDWHYHSVMLGVPTGWRTRDRDCITDPNLDELFALADIISPWTPGRYRTPEEVAHHAEENWRPDLEETQKTNQGYLPVVFPGFSWHNLMHRESALGAIPRLGGRFLWKQFLEAKSAGATGAYVAMFDEMDEGTAIFKCTNNPPVGESPFLTYEDLPSDHYLWLCGEAGRLFREELPERKSRLRH